MLHEATNPRRGRRRLVIALATLVVIALVATGLVTYYLRGTAVDPSGGMVTSDDGTVTVTFSAGEVKEGTRIDIDVGLGGRPPPDMVAPLDRPFDITAVRGQAHTGLVNVQVGSLPPGVAPDLVVMLVEDAAGWRVLDTTYDPVTGTASARWPHFSRGFPGYLDPLFDRLDFDASEKVRAGAAIEWSGELFDRARRWATERTADIAEKVIEGLVAATGGTVHEITCDPAAEDWKFTSSVSDGESTTSDLLTGCGYPFDTATDSSPIRVGNRAPYPFLLSLPRGVVGPGWQELGTTMEVEDAIASLLWSLEDYAVLPAGKSMRFTINKDAGSTVQINGVIDISTLAVRAIALVAVYLSSGESAAVRAELRQIVEQLNKRFLDQRRTGLTEYTWAELQRDLGYDSPLSREIRAANLALDAHRIDQALNIVAFMNCVIPQARDASGQRNLSEAIDQIMGSCYQTFAERTVRNTLGKITGRLDPQKQAKMNAELVKGLIIEALNIRQLVSARDSLHLGILTGGKIDLTRAGLTIQCVAGPCTTWQPFLEFPDCDQVPAGTTVPGASQDACSDTVDADLDGNGIQDILVLWHPRPTGQLDTQWTTKQVGAVALFDDGSSHQLEDLPATWKWPSGENFTINLFDVTQVLRLGTDDRQQVVVAIEESEYSMTHIILAVGTDRRLHTVSGSLDGEPFLMFRGGEGGEGSDFGCVTSAGRPLLSITTTSGGFEQNPEFYEFLDTRVRYVGHNGGESSVPC